MPRKQEITDDAAYVDWDTGLAYCMGEEELYEEVLSVFCEQSTAYLSQLETFFENRDWEQYAIIAHALKSSAMNVGAANFSKLSLQHELAAKEGKEEFILTEFTNYIAVLKALIEILKKRERT